MAEVLIENWLQVTTALVAAVVLALGHRWSANLAFETSYRKGFFTQGTLFGMCLGLPGALFTSTWRQIETPNLANQQQLEMTPDDGEERWRSGLAQTGMGLGVMYYQLIVVVFLHTPAIGSAWFWLAALALVVTGIYRFQGAMPPFHMLLPLTGDELADPPDLGEMVIERHAWGRMHARRVKADYMAMAGVWLASVAGLAMTVFWCAGWPEAQWVATALCLTVLAAGIAGWFFMRRRTDELSRECDRMIMSAVPEGKQRELLDLRRRFFYSVRWLHAAGQLRLVYFVLPPALALISFAVGMWKELPAFFWLAGVLFLSWIPAGTYLKRMMAEVKPTVKELEDLNTRLEQLTGEVEAEVIEQARRESKEEMQEVYSFQMGDLVGRRMHVPEEIRQRIKVHQLDDDLRGELSEDMARQEDNRMQWVAMEQEYMAALLRSRAVTFWLGCAIAALMIILGLLRFSAGIMPALKYTALACFVYALGTYLPERFAGLRDRSMLRATNVLLGIAVAIVLIIVLSTGWPPLPPPPDVPRPVLSV